MKKQILFITAIIALSATSCRKERTCECKTTSTDTVTGFGAGTNQSTTSSKLTEAGQKKNTFKHTSGCFSNKGTNTSYGGVGIASYTVVSSYETTCELK